MATKVDQNMLSKYLKYFGPLLSIVGVLGWCYSVINYVKLTDEWGDHVRGKHEETASKVVSKERWQSVSKDDLIRLVVAGNSHVDLEYGFMRVSYKFILITTTIAVFSSIAASVGVVSCLVTIKRLGKNVPKS